jgi:hypothetical protein
MTSQEQAQKFNVDNKDNTYVFPPFDSVNLGDQSRFICKGHPAPYLELLIDAPYADMLAEARALEPKFVTHREGDSHGWRSLCVHGISAEKTDAANSYNLDAGDQSIYNWTEIVDECPVTYNYFKNTFPYIRYQRVRFMLVEPGGYIEPHSDNANPMLTAAINISLNNPDECYLTTPMGYVPFKNSGSMFLFNNHYQHCVVNNSNEQRFHMIVHGQWRSPLFEQIMVNSYQHAVDNQK